MPKRSDVRTLKNLIDQAYSIASSDPIPKGGMESIRENLDAARAMVRFLLIKPKPETAAAELGRRGGAQTAKRGAEYYAKIAGLRKERKGGRPTKHLDVLASNASPSSVRSRSAFVIAKRAKELSMDLEGIAKAIHSSVQYTGNLLQGTAIPSDAKLQDIIAGLDLDNLKIDQLRTFVAEDRRRHDGRYRTRGI